MSPGSRGSWLVDRRPPSIGTLPGGASSPTATATRSAWLPRRGPHRERGTFVQITLDYPIVPRPRWGHGHPAHSRLHAILDRGRERYRRHLRDIAALAPRLRAIPVEPSQDDVLAPAWSK